jgi:hypothetical protein
LRIALITIGEGRPGTGIVKVSVEGEAAAVDGSGGGSPQPGDDPVHDVFLSVLLVQFYGLPTGRDDSAVHCHIHLVLLVLLNGAVRVRDSQHVSGQRRSDRVASLGYRRLDTFDVSRRDEGLIGGAECLVGCLLRIPGAAG